MGRIQWREILTFLVTALTLSSGTSNEKSSDLELLTSKPSRCTYERAYNMYGAHCGGLKLEAIPKYLKGSIEILDMSDNKLRELTKNTFSSYTSIKYLYLAENPIYFIDPDAFTALTDLQTLDLTKNALWSVPENLFKMPSLRKLYLGGNPLSNLDYLMTLPKPLKAPLEHLDISNCKFRELPDLGVLPELVVFNISHNPLTSLDPIHFARTCKLMTVDMSRSIDEIDLCALRPAVDWLSRRRVAFLLEDVEYAKLNSNDFHACPHVPLDHLNATFSNCNAEYVVSTMSRTSRTTWLTITGGLAGFLVIFILILYLMHRSNVAATKKANDKKIHTPKNDKDKMSTNLLLEGPR